MTQDEIETLARQLIKVEPTPDNIEAVIGHLSVDEGGVVIKRSQEILRSQAQRKMDEAAALRGMHDLDAIVSKQGGQ
jgi:hypothetical protein